MTCIVGVAQGGRMLLMGDSALSDSDGALDIITDPKVVKVKGRLIGFAGDMTSLRLMRRLRLSDRQGDPRDEMEEIVTDLKKISDELALKTFGDNEERKEFEPSFLFGIGGKLFVLGEDWGWFEPAPTWRRQRHRRRETLQFYAIGSGGKYAMGALAAQADAGLTMAQRAEEALRISSQFCSVVRPPFTHVEA